MRWEDGGFGNRWKSRSGVVECWRGLLGLEGRGSCSLIYLSVRISARDVGMNKVRLVGWGLHALGILWSRRQEFYLRAYIMQLPFVLLRQLDANLMEHISAASKQEW